MITNVGKNLLAKYLIGQAPAYASYVALGCGRKPVSNLTYNVTNISATTTVTTLTVAGHEFVVGDSVFVKLASAYAARNGTYTVSSVATNTISFSYAGGAISSTATTGTATFNFSNKTSLDFEMFRVPISSRGYINEDGVSKIVLTGELPTVERYEITEIGIYSSASNPTAGAYDSKTVYSFSTSENWEYHTATTATTIPIVSGPLATDPLEPAIISQTSPVFQTNADNKTLLDINRLNRYESCRYLNNTIFIAGNESTLSIPSGSKMVAANGSKHIHLLGANVDFNKNSANDELKLAFSIVNKSATPTANGFHPTGVKLLIEFADSDAGDAQNYAQFQVDIANGTGPGQQNFATNRYVLVTRQLKDLTKSATFTWNSVNVVKIWASVLGAEGTPTSDYYVALDALRLENTSSVNPLYGMTGYSVVRSPDLLPIVKVSNTANLVEFRFALDVDLDV